MIVDSCTRGNDVLPLAYLERLGVDVGTAVSRIVATHWDLDHVQGLGRVAEQCVGASLTIPRSLEPELVVQYVGSDLDLDDVHPEDDDQVAKLRFRRSTMEFRQAILSSTKFKYAGPLTVVRRRQSQAGIPEAYVEALSPSDAVFEEHVQQISGLVRLAQQVIPISEDEVKRRLENHLRRNGCSIALWVRVGDRLLLLGADLETSADASHGWRAVVGLEDRDTSAGTRANVLKVPHHGSKNARDPHLWQELVQREATAIVAPWYRGGRWLPTTPDIEELRKLAEVTWCCCMPPTSGALPPDKREGEIPVGYVTLRSPAAGPPAWSIVAAESAQEFRR